MEKKELVQKAQSALGELMGASNHAMRALEEIVKGAGGFIPTLPSLDKPALKVTIAYDTDSEEEMVFALRYIEGEGLFLCTESMLDNYEWDHNHCFESYHNFEGEDAEEIQKVIANTAYFISIDDDRIVRNQTIISILAGLPAYL